MGGTGSKLEPSNFGYCDGGCWHPHVHALVSRGGWTRDWEWIPLAYVDERAAELLDRHKVMRILIRARYTIAQLRLPPGDAAVKVVYLLLESPLLGSFRRAPANP